MSITLTLSFMGNRGHDAGRPWFARRGRVPDVSSGAEHSVDDETVARIRAGDVRAFDELYLRYAERLWTFARRYVRTDDLAEDLVHDVFLALWARRAEWTPEDVHTYLFKSILNRALQVGRHRGVVMRTRPMLAEYRVATGLAARPDDEVERSSDAALVARLLAELPDRARTAVHLRWYENMSYADIGRVLGTSEEGARKATRRALDELQALLRRHS